MNKQEELQNAIRVFNRRVERLKREYLEGVPAKIIEDEYELIKKAGEEIKRLNKFNYANN